MGRLTLCELLAICVVGLLMVPLQAEAKKCPPGQYGVFKCIKCPANTYAYKAHILTRIGCKKCPKGTSSRAGSRQCTGNPCKGKINGKNVKLRSGASMCVYSTGRKKKCTRGKWSISGYCRVCSAKGPQGYRKNFSHGKKRCANTYWYTCRDGSWLKGASCKTYKNCNASSGLKAGKHGSSQCHSTNRYRYTCHDGSWRKGSACPKRACPLNGTNRPHGTKVCKPGRIKGEGTLIQCNDGSWKVISRTCK